MKRPLLIIGTFSILSDILYQRMTYSLATKKIIRLFFHILLLVFLSLNAAALKTACSQEARPPTINADYALNADYQQYLKFFQEVYNTMDKNYYHPVGSQDFMKFIYIFNTRLYLPLRLSGKSSDYIKWRSAAFLVDELKAEDDIFSKFFPPPDAKRYETEVLGKRIDLGIEGAITMEGFIIKWVEPRSDAYEKGLRGKDMILGINDVDVTTLSQEKIQELLEPLEGETVKIKFYSVSTGTEQLIEPVSKEYFKQAVFMIPVGVPDVYCIQIQRFNRMTGEDMAKLMEGILKNKNSSLIIDLRGNPGGPPLAAREISAFFLPPKEEFAYFQRKNYPKSSLAVPEIPEDSRFHGDIVILVNEKSGSSSELFAGILQSRGRAVLMGKNTAGQVFLKSMFYFEDNSMVLLVTARGYHPDGEVFSYSGVVPDIKKEDQDDLIVCAAQYLSEKRRSTRH